MSDDELLARSEESLASAKEAAGDVPDQLGHESPDEALPPLSVVTDTEAAQEQAHAADPEAAPEEEDGEEDTPDPGDASGADDDPDDAAAADEG